MGQVEAGAATEEGEEPAAGLRERGEDSLVVVATATVVARVVEEVELAAVAMAAAAWGAGGEEVEAKARVEMVRAAVVMELVRWEGVVKALVVTEAVAWAEGA